MGPGEVGWISRAFWNWAKAHRSAAALEPCESVARLGAFGRLRTVSCQMENSEQ